MTARAAGFSTAWIQPCSSQIAHDKDLLAAQTAVHLRLRSSILQGQMAQKALMPGYGTWVASIRADQNEAPSLSHLKAQIRWSWDNINRRKRSDGWQGLGLTVLVSETFWNSQILNVQCNYRRELLTEGVPPSRTMENQTLSRVSSSHVGREDDHKKTAAQVQERDSALKWKDKK